MKHYLDLILINIINNIEFSGGEDIKDIKDIIAYDLRYLYIFILLTIIISLILFFMLRKKKNIVPEKEKFVLPPETVALDKIKKLKGSNLIEQKKYKEFYTILSEIIREYFELKYNIPALDCTTYELISELKKKNIIMDKVRIVQDFLIDCDMVKFAKFIPRDEDPDKMLLAAEDIININSIKDEQKKVPAEKKINV